MTKQLNNPDYVIDIGQLNSPADILKTFRKLNIKNYAYTIEHSGKIIKIGRSTGDDPGERLYRQVANFPGWCSEPLSSSGSDIKPAIEQFEEKYNVTVTRNNCIANIWDVTGEISDSITDPNRPSRLAENSLLNEYEQIHGELPPGNRKDTRREMIKPYVTTDLFDNLFEPTQ